MTAVVLHISEAYPELAEHTGDIIHALLLGLDMCAQLSHSTLKELYHHKTRHDWNGLTKACYVCAFRCLAQKMRRCGFGPPPPPPSGGVAACTIKPECILKSKDVVKHCMDVLHRNAVHFTFNPADTLWDEATRSFEKTLHDETGQVDASPYIERVSAFLALCKHNGVACATHATLPDKTHFVDMPACRDCFTINIMSRCKRSAKFNQASVHAAIKEIESRGAALPVRYVVPPIVRATEHDSETTTTTEHVEQEEEDDPFADAPELGLWRRFFAVDVCTYCKKTCDAMRTCEKCSEKACDVCSKGETWHCDAHDPVVVFYKTNKRAREVYGDLVGKLAEAVERPAKRQCV